MNPAEEKRKKARDLARYFHVHDPAEQADQFFKLAQKLESGDGRVRFDNNLNKIIRDLIGGDLMMLLARTGNGKTSLSAALARDMARKIKNGEAGNENSIVLFVTLEQQVEYIELMLAGNKKYDASMLINGEVSADEYKKWMIERPSLPLWMIGESIAHSREPHDRLYLETIIDGIESIYIESKKEPLIIFVDYLQQAKLRDGTWGNRNAQIIEAADALKALAMRYDVPVVMGSQSRQEVDDYKDKLPRIRDSMWASEAGHYADVAISIMMLAKYWNPEDHPEVEIGDRWYNNDGTTIIASVLKGRFQKGYGRTSIQLNPKTLEINNGNLVDFNEYIAVEIPFAPDEVN